MVYFCLSRKIQCQRRKVYYGVYYRSLELAAETFEKMPLKNPLLSMLLGCFALFMCSFGYYGIYS